jgi:hypothetical protein
MINFSSYYPNVEPQDLNMSMDNPIIFFGDC